MNTKLIQSRFLSLPIWDMPEKIETYIALLLLAGPAGEVERAIESLFLQTGIQRAVLSYVIDCLADKGFIRKDNGSVFVVEHPCFAMDVQGKKKNKDVSLQPKKELGISERIAIFASELQREVDKWETRTQLSFPTEQVQEFLGYWTEHGEKDRKFRQENCDKWDWQRRLTTWYKRMPVKDNAEVVPEETISRERERMKNELDKRIAEREAATGAYLVYLDELRKAVSGDHAMRAKHPNWESLAKRHDIKGEKVKR